MPLIGPSDPSARYSFMHLCMKWPPSSHSRPWNPGSSGLSFSSNWRYSTRRKLLFSLLIDGFLLEVIINLAFIEVVNPIWPLASHDTGSPPVSCLKMDDDTKS